MDKALKTKWVEALRSGKYEQGRGYLRTKEEQFCCLGVLCDLVAPEEWHLYSALGEGETKRFEFRQTTRYLDGRLADEIALNQDRTKDLMFMNDDGKSFAYIADWIEQNL